MFKNQRNTDRVSSNLPIQLGFGSQITLSGQIKDLSLKAAFVIVKSSIHMATHDELTFTIENLPFNIDGTITGSARISRVAPGEGIAIFFIKLDDTSNNLLHRLVGQTAK
jgi:hypothetical protein